MKEDTLLSLIKALESQRELGTVSGMESADPSLDEFCVSQYVKIQDSLQTVKQIFAGDAVTFRKAWEERNEY